MKRIICSFVMMIILYLIQTTIFNKITVAGIKPNVVIILVVLIGYKYGKIIGYLVGFSNKLYTNDSTLIPLGLVGASDFMLNFLIFITGFLLRNRLDLPYYMMRIILPEVVYTIIVSVLLYRIMDYIYVKLETIGKGDES